VPRADRRRPRAAIAALALGLLVAGCSGASVPELRSPIVFKETPRMPSAAGRETVGRAVVTGDSVRLRAGPGTGHAVIGGVGAGDRLEVLGRRPGWLEVRHGGKSAWIAADFAREDGPAVTATPPPAASVEADTSGRDEGSGEEAGGEADPILPELGDGGRVEPGPLPEF